MGAWDYGPFDNDAAMNWVGNIEENCTPEQLIHFFTHFATLSDDYLTYEYPDANELRAAVAIILAVQAQYNVDDLPDGVQEWIIATRLQFPPMVLVAAARALDRLIADLERTDCHATMFDAWWADYSREMSRYRLDGGTDPRPQDLEQWRNTVTYHREVLANAQELRAELQRCLDRLPPDDQGPPDHGESPKSQLQRP